MRSITFSFAMCLTVSMFLGCQGAEEPKKVDVPPEVKAANDQEHAAKADAAAKGIDPGTVGGGSGTAAQPSAAGHGK